MQRQKSLPIYQPTSLRAHHRLRAAHRQRGVAAVPIVLVLLILTIAIGLEITSIAVTQNLASAGQDRSSQAFRYAETGARDALVRIARNKAYGCMGVCYTIEFVTNGCTNNNACARVSVSTGIGTAGDPKVVTSEGQVQGAIRKVQVDVVYDAAQDGEIVSTTWQELTN